MGLLQTMLACMRCAARAQCAHMRLSPSRSRTRPMRCRPRGGGKPEEKKFVQNTNFGYSRKDVILICAALFALPFGMRAILEDGLGYTSTYLFRVGRKEMTYITQLKEYEEAVMLKRLEEMPSAEVEKLMEEIGED